MPSVAVPRSQDLGPGVAGKCLGGIRALLANGAGWPCSLISHSFREGLVGTEPPLWPGFGART